MSKIFLVDDDKFLLDMYALKFHNKGHEVDTCTDGNEALKRLREGYTPDGMILDVVMPQMDGLTILEAIRKENLIPGSSIIMLTNQGQPTDIEKAEKLGINGYIIKATTIPSEVVGEVEKILNK
jgi:CheY-like chemotaxis protein